MSHSGPALGGPHDGKWLESENFLMRVYLRRSESRVLMGEYKYQFGCWLWKKAEDA